MANKDKKATLKAIDKALSSISTHLKATRTPPMELKVGIGIWKIKRTCHLVKF